MKTARIHDQRTLSSALEKAAKHICTARCGRCPHVIEQYPCPGECTLDTLAWECWARFFLDQATPPPTHGENG